MALLGSWAADLLVAISVLAGFVYYYITSPYDTWKRQKVPYIEPRFPFGSFSKTTTSGKISHNQIFQEFYTTFKTHGFGGVFLLGRPGLIVCKPELIKDFLSKDFNSFHARGLPYDEKNDTFSANLLHLSGPRWKTIRAKLSPTFTSGKIKGMFPLIQECTQELRECLQEEIKKNNGSVDMKELLTRYATDVIGSCAFGMKCNSIKNSQSDFYHISREVFRRNVRNRIRFALTSLFPKLASVLTFKRLFPEVVTFFDELMRNTVKFRNENNVERNDFVQLMMKINKDDPTAFSHDVMTAQAFMFFLAGLDNVSQNIGFCLHALAVDPALQDRVYQDVRTVLDEHKGEMSYEATGKMDLVSRVLDEGLRLYPPGQPLIRKQTEDKYVIPGTDVVMTKGTIILIPTQALHRDEDYFPNPGKFDPDRFTEEEKEKRHPYAYLPFGEGPRFCIASRFAQLEMRLCLAELVRQFQFGVAPETDLSLELDPQASGPTPIRGFWLTVSERLRE